VADGQQDKASSSSDAVGDPWDDLPIEIRRDRFGWFGLPWWSYECYDDAGRLIAEMRKPFPAGESCLYCGELFSEDAGDSGKATPLIKADGTMQPCHVHKECFMRDGSGGIAHQEGRCHCHGGTDEGTPGMSRRQEALAVWEHWTKRGKSAL
jgi:hypothetical protein